MRAEIQRQAMAFSAFGHGRTRNLDSTDFSFSISVRAQRCDTKPLCMHILVNIGIHRYAHNQSFTQKYKCVCERQRARVYVYVRVRLRESMCVCVCVRVCVSNNGGTLKISGYSDLIQRSAGSMILSDTHTNYTYLQIHNTYKGPQC